MKKNYPWTRFWTPREAELTLYSGAYLPDPEDAYGRLHNPRVSKFQAISGGKCNVLLGEGGMGKSRSLERDHPGSRSVWESQKEYGVLIDLGKLSNYGDIDLRLQQETDVQKWRQRDGLLHLTLDSLDEALPFLPNLPKILLGVLGGLPKDSLRFSIACRSVAWPPFLEDGLADLFGRDALQVWRLAPLRQEDVRMAAAANDLDGDLFLRAVAEKNVEAMAAHPLTLELLLRSASGGTVLSDDLTVLYERGCRTFLHERPDSGRAAVARRMDVDQMMAVAGRIACVTLFGGRTAIDANEIDPCEMGTVSIGDLASGSETVRGVPFDVGTLDVREVIQSGLFNRAGSQFRWIHKTFAEFLAAHHLRDASTSLSQIVKLLGTAGQIAPALAAIAAWLATMREDVVAEILRIDPEVLLEADLSKCSASVQAALVEFLFREAEAESPFVYQWGLFWRFKKLKHPGLRDQLELRLDTSRPMAVRKLAIGIANACGGAGLTGKLAELALNDKEPLFFRIEAASWLSDFGSADEKVSLRPLALRPGGDKDEQRLQAYALSAVWPFHARWHELRDTIGTQDYQQTDALGRFLAHDFVKGLAGPDIADCLIWLDQEHSTPNALSGWSGATDQLIIRATNLVNDPAIRQALAGLLAARITKHHLAFDSHGSSKREVFTLGPPEMRHLLAAELVPQLGGRTHVGWLLLQGPAPLLVENDLEFAIGQWKNANPIVRPSWECIVGALTNWESPEARSEVYSLTADRPELKAALKDWYRTKRHFKKRDVDRQKKEQIKSARKRIVRIRRLRDLITLSEREPRMITQLLQLMAAPLESDFVEKMYHPNIRELPGWTVLTACETERLIDAAKRFLAGGPSYTATSLRHGGPSWSNLAAYKILRDRMVHEPKYVASLPVRVLSKWIPGILLCQITQTNGELDGPDRALRELVFTRAPNVVRWAAALVLRTDRIHNPERALQWLVSGGHSIGVDEIVLDAIRRSTVSDNLYIAGLRLLFEHDCQEAHKFADDNFNRLKITGISDHRIAVSCAVWVEKRRERVWPTVWTEMKCTSDFAKAVFGVMYSEGKIDITLGSWLPEGDCLDLYRWLRSVFGTPPNSDPFQRDLVHTLQGHILHWLQERFTMEAVAALDQLDRDYPGDWWIRKCAWEAHRGLIQRGWQPLNPTTVRHVIEDRRHLLVRDETELMEDLLETRGELQVKLHDTGDRARRLWNEYHVAGSLAYKPKPEEPVSREIALELMDLLKRRGVTATLETKIRDGEYVDIHVSAMTASSQPQWITLIIEVKGCWNPGVRTSLDSQLAQRYLKNKRSPYGIYLVVWFTCAQWDEGDAKRKALASRDSLEDLRAFLEAEARRVSTNNAICIKSFVLDATLPGVPGKPKAVKKPIKGQSTKRVTAPGAAVKKRLRR